MPIVHIIVILLVIGVLLAVVNRYCAEFIDGTILKIINIVAIVATILWLLSVVLGYNVMDFRVGR